MSARTTLIASALTLTALVGASACSGPSAAQAGESVAGATTSQEPVVVHIGIGEVGPINDAVAEVAAENGITIEYTSFSDWTLPNQALANGEIDANAFQHVAFLSTFNVAQDEDIVPVGSTVITTWGLYSDAYESVEDLPDGATIALPNDPANWARSLFLLEDAGLITLEEGVGVYPTEEDIAENPHDLTFEPVVAQQLVNTLPDVDAVVVGAVTIQRALGTTKDEALHLDDPTAPSSRPYVNTVAVRSQDADNPVYAQIASFYQDPRVVAAVEEDSFGATVVVDVPAEELVTTLGELEALARDAA